ncbi:MAG: LysM peptidoglycan-binding domain-containing protein [Moorellaceae bacterium]
MDAQQLPRCPGGTYYVVQSGDTMFYIAQRLGLSLDDLIAANPQVTDPNLIFPGQVLCIPLKGRPACPHGFIYVVRPGDTLFEIARRFGTTVERIVAANPQITDPNVIFPGQRLCIPLFPPHPRRRYAFPFYGTDHAPQGKGVGIADWDHKMLTVMAWDLPDPHTCGMDKYVLLVRYKENEDFVAEDMNTTGYGIVYCHHRLREDPVLLSVLPVLIVGARIPFRWGPLFLGGFLPVIW